MIHRGHRALGVAHPQSEILEGCKGLGAGHLMDQVQADEQLGGATRQLGDPVQISAEHGEGLAELHAALRPYAPDDAVMERGGTEAEDEPLAAPEDRPIRVAIIGRPKERVASLLASL